MRTQKITDILTFLKRSKGLETALRYRSSLKHLNNTVAEHSWRLALMTLIIGMECKDRVNMNRALSLALVHDLAEATTGDIDAYEQIVKGKKVIQNKSLMEELAMREMTNDISFGDWIFSLWQEYEEQKTIESKFVKALDRIEGFLHIAEVGVEDYIPKEFHADYATKAVTTFDEAAQHFPELIDFLNAVKADLKTQFEKAGVRWIDAK